MANFKTKKSDVHLATLYPQMLFAHFTHQRGSSFTQDFH